MPPSTKQFVISHLLPLIFFILNIFFCRTFGKHIIKDCYKLAHFCLFQVTQFSRSASACQSSSSNRRNPASASVPAGTRLKRRVQRVPPPSFQPQHSSTHRSPLLPHYPSPQSLLTIQLQQLHPHHAVSPSLPLRWVR